MKINSIQRAVFAVLFMTVFASGAHAFSYASHAVVCDLAYQYAAPETQKMISGLVRSPNHQFCIKNTQIAYHIMCSLSRCLPAGLHLQSDLGRYFCADSTCLPLPSQISAIILSQLTN